MKTDFFLNQNIIKYLIILEIWRKFLVPAAGCQKKFTKS